MTICEECGKEFNEYDADSQFREETSLTVSSISYEQLGRCLCGECAIAAYANGEYFENCEICGKKFYPEDENERFKRAIDFRNIDADMYVDRRVLCADCALEYYDD